MSFLNLVLFSFCFFFFFFLFLFAFFSKNHIKNKNLTYFSFFFLFFFLIIFLFIYIFFFLSPFENYFILNFNNIGPVNTKNSNIITLTNIEKYQLATFLNKAAIDNCFFGLDTDFFLENLNSYDCFKEDNCFVCLVNSNKFYNIEDCFLNDFKYCTDTNKLICLEKYQNFRRSLF